jgi:GH15 family glucan-1,4-alpha-glucosidase
MTLHTFTPHPFNPSVMLPFIPYPRVAHHGLVGDRRTAALVSSDGTIDWLCAPDFDSAPVFGALLDAERGGYCRFGPVIPRSGRQAYEPNTAILTTKWTVGDTDLELTDAMLQPGDDRRDRAGPAIARRLRCVRGRAACAYRFAPRDDFGAGEPCTRDVRSWTSANVGATFDIDAGEEAWAIVSVGDDSPWSSARATRAVEGVRAFWLETLARVTYDGVHADAIRSAALVLHLLTFAPTGAVVAAATAGLPERVGGDRNYDYRYSWIRDCSLALGVFANLGDSPAASRFFDWLTHLESPHGAALQVCYGIRGEKNLRQAKRADIEGYRCSAPVVFGNNAYKQLQLGSVGYLADCAWLHLDAGGGWKPEYDELLARCAENTCESWQRDDSGLWELAHKAPFTMSKVMCWVALDRVVRVAERTGSASSAERARWRKTADEIRAEVLDRGWSQRKQSFRQRYGSDAVDAGLLLLPIMRFLPPTDPRVTSTLARIEEELTIDGYVYRFVPRETPGEGDRPVGDFEGSFLPCLFWLASAHALAGRVREAERVLKRALATAREPQLFAEQYDPRTGDQVGNYPQLFTHAECVRAILDVDAAMKRGEGKPVP